MLKFAKVGPIGVPILTPLECSYNVPSAVLNGVFVVQVLSNSSNISLGISLGIYSLGITD